MFTWICPKCGGEVPPSKSECPRCSGSQQAEPQPAVPAQAQRPPAPVYSPTPQAPAVETAPPQAAPVQQAQQQYAPPPPPPQYPPQYAAPAPPPPQPTYVLPEPKRRFPGWLAAILTFAVLGAALFGLYKYTSNGQEAKQPVEMQTPAVGSGEAHPFAKFLEVTGLRVFEDDKKRIRIRYVVVNHSVADMPGLELRIALMSTKAAEGEPPVAVVDAKVGNLGPHESKDMESPLESKLRAYELPDWQFLTPKFEVTAPGR